MEPKFDITGTKLAEMAKSVPSPIGGVAANSGKYESSNPDSPYYTPRNPVSVISTARARSNLQSLEQTHNQDIQRLSVEENNKKINEDKFRKVAEANDRRNGGLSADELNVVGGTLDNYTFNNTSGLYIPKTTQSGQTVDHQQQLQDDIDKVFAQQEGLIDASTNAQMNSIRQTYSDLAKEQREANDVSQRNLLTYGARTGLSRYSGERFGQIQNATISEGIKTLGKLASDEYKLIAQAESARAGSKYTLFAKKRDELVQLRKERQKTLDEMQKDIQKKKDDAQKQKIQSSRDSAIANLVSQGITDPKQILNYLNYDDQGNLVGDITAKEIADALKNLAPEDNIDKLSGATRDFYILKGTNQLPSGISSLPENEQLFAYLAAEKRASSIPPKGSAGNKITLSEAKSQGLPISTVGMSEADIAESFLQSNPPAWFVEKMQAETNTRGDKATIPGAMSLAPNSQAMIDSWNNYRNVFNAGGKADKNSVNYTKAKQYFTSSYEGLSEEELDSLATQVETYVNGGKSYADAVEQTIKDIE